MLGAPDLHFRRHPLGEIGRSRDIAGDIAPPNRVPERGMQGAMDVADRLGSKTATTPPMATAKQSSIEGRELCRRQPLEREVPEGGDNVPVDVPGGNFLSLSRQTAYGQIADALRAAILVGDYEPTEEEPRGTSCQEPSNLARSTASVTRPPPAPFNNSLRKDSSWRGLD